jgi:hypothetical protein
VHQVVVLEDRALLLQPLNLAKETMVVVVEHLAVAVAVALVLQVEHQRELLAVQGEQELLTLLQEHQ